RVRAAARARAAGRPRALLRLALGGADEYLAARQLERGLDRLAQAARLRRIRPQPVDHRFDRVPPVALELGRFLHAHDPTGDARADQTAALEVVEHLAVLALAVAHDRREHGRRLAGELDQRLLDDRLGRLRAQRQVALGAVRRPGARVDDAQVVEDLGQRADG